MIQELNGYAFESEADYEQAVSELNGIKYVGEQLKNASVIQQYKIYCNIIEKRLFSTPVGLSYLNELQNYLKKQKELDNYVIPNIPVKTGLQAKNKGSNTIHIVIPVVASLISIILTLAIAVNVLNNSNNLNVVNYKRVLNAEYSEKLKKVNAQLKETKETKEEKNTTKE